MPTLTEHEMAAVIDPALMQPLGDDEDEAQALRSQLMAAMEQNKRAYEGNLPTVVGNEASSTVLHTTAIDHDAAPQVKQTHSVNGYDVLDHNALLANEKIQPDTTTGPVLDAAPAEAQNQQDPDNQEMHEDQDEEQYADTDTDTDTDIQEQEQEQEQEDNDEYESAASNAEEVEEDTVQVETRQALSEDDQAEASESDSGSDEEMDFCMFCNQRELDDESHQDDLSCAVCRRPAHLACAYLKDLAPEDLKLWRCPSCSENRTSESPKETANKPRHSAPRLVRDLLPVSRGVQKPGAHSIFAQTLIPDDEGGRALRKRKSPSAERVPRSDKRRKKMRETAKAVQVEPEVTPHSTRRSSQKLASGLPSVPTARILQHRPFHKPPPHKFILAFRLEQSKIAAILSEPPRPNRRRDKRRKQKIQAPPPYQPPVPKFPALPTQHLIFPSMFGDRENEINAKPYGGILSEAEAETSRSLPQMRDREIFEIARKEAEEERKRTSAKAEAEINGLNGEGANATNSKRTVSGPPSKIKCIQFGKYVIDTSYAAPYPEEYSHESRLFICEFCLKYLPSEFVAWRHKLKCPAKHPPGDEIYRDGSLSIWEVDGRKKTEYCQCLCLMAKLFLGSKTLYYDVDPFLFYVLTEYDEYGYHFVGYFSKEKRPASQNNVSCILVMPIHQRKGYATFLIEFSYLLTRIEGKEGSPEKPLSDMGLTAYRSYWDLTISRHLLELDDKPFSVRDIMARTGMTADDVVHSLERLYAFIKDPVTKTYAIRYDKKLYQNIVDKYESKDFRKIRPERLVWTPYIMGRSDAATLDAQPIQAMAQRDDETQDGKLEEVPEQFSPKTTEAVSRESPSNALIDPALLNERGNIAPGPPPVDAIGGLQPVVADPKPEEIMTNGSIDKGKAPAEEPLSGYALAYKIEKIPPTRFAIDPPIPAYLLKKQNVRRKSTAGTPRTNGAVNGKPKTPLAVRSSPRKAGSVTGSSVGQGGSRLTSPDKGSVSVRRSGRRSGLVNEITTSDASDVEEDEDVAIHDEEEDEQEELDAKSAIGEELADESSDQASGSDDEISDRSEESADEDEEDVEEESDASNDPDVEVDEEDEEDESNDEDEEEEAEVDIPSVISSIAASDDEAEGSTEED